MLLRKLIAVFMIIFSFCLISYAQNVKNYFDASGTGTDNIFNIGGTQNIISGGSLNIKSGGTLTVESGSTLTVSGTLSVPGSQAISSSGGLTLTYGINAATGSFSGDLIISGLIKAGSSPVTLTNATGNILPASLAAGSLPATVICSSLAINSVKANNIDLTDLTGADLTLTDCGAITSTALITGKGFTNTGKNVVSSYSTQSDSFTVTASTTTSIFYAGKVGGLLVTLPAASTCAGSIFTFICTTSGANTFSENINGGSFTTWDEAGDAVTIHSNGTAWYTLSMHEVP